MAWQNTMNMNLQSQPLQDYLGKHGRIRFFTNKKGQRLAHYFWPAKQCNGPTGRSQQPRAVIHLVHGHGGYLCHDYLKFWKPGHLHVYEGFTLLCILRCQTISARFYFSKPPVPLDRIKTTHVIHRNIVVVVLHTAATALSLPAEQ
ncbi:hypothetical protein DUNSADRAFT_2254 [Dunaliella salina]|uniref:Uncharacterized protein n=1 Tax=Dunaliella salina TaxID=3046 RepID=A0ABQ7GW00_DUNSA|nr:hypothetical protein DUNSADRAFT_2254 [Dunaliella salina]|eukprot:KAF5838791.1 hypothetical protein DUNSADRAFT_2254 [Dunaliella salina]